MTKRKRKDRIFDATVLSSKPPVLVHRNDAYDEFLLRFLALPPEKQEAILQELRAEVLGKKESD